MEINEILNVAMCDEEIANCQKRKNEIVDEVETRKSTFETSDVETRDSLLKEVEDLTNEANSIDEKLAKLNEVRESYAKQEEAMSMTKQLERCEEKAMEIRTNEFATKEYEQKYADFIRGKINESEMRASLSTGTDNIPVPTTMQSYVETAWTKYGKFSQLVKETFVKGLLTIPYEVSADGAVWHDENSVAPTEEKITLGQILLAPKTIKKWISLTDELMAMVADEFLKYVADELVYQIVKALDDAIINRTSSDNKGVIGIVGNALTEKAEVELGFNTINEAIANLNSFDNLVVAMNPQTFFKNVMGLKDTTGQPIYRVSADNEGKAKYFMGGYRVEFTDTLPTYDDATSGEAYAVVGNFADGYRVNYAGGSKGVSTIVDPYTLATEDVVRMVGKLLVAGNVVKPKHFVEIDKKA